MVYTAIDFEDEGGLSTYGLLFLEGIEKETATRGII